MRYPELKIDCVNVWAGPTTPQVAKAVLITLTFFKNESCRHGKPHVVYRCVFICISYFNF